MNSVFKLFFFLLASQRSLTREDENRWRELFVSAREGDARAYERLLEEMYLYLERFCKRYLYSPSQVEDCIQECLMSIHRAKHTYDPNRPIAPWFFTIVRHKITDQYRKAVDTVELSEEDSCSGSTIDLSEELSKLLTKLSPAHREVFELTKLSNKPFSELAVEMNIGESALKVRSHRACTALRKLITEEFTREF